MTRKIEGADAVRALVGCELGVSDWHAIEQADIDRFAAATEDFQWIHVDPHRAQDSPFGTTVAHGLFTLSLGPMFSYAIYTFEGFSAGVNYGFERVRFPAPVPPGSRVRMRATLLDVTDVAGGIQVTVRQRFEREHGDKPVCVADSVARWVE